MKRLRIASWIVPLVIAGAPVAGARGAEPAPTIEDVKKAWTARQDANKSFRVEWVETVKIKAGAWDAPAKSDGSGPHPPKDTEFKGMCSFAADGDRIAAANERPIYNVPKADWQPHLSATMFDGKTITWMDGHTQPGWARVRVEKNAKPVGHGFDSAINAPVLHVFRPLGGGPLPAFGFETYKLTGRTQQIRGAGCVQLVLKDAPKNDAITDFGYALWCDVERGFLPVRVRQRDETRGYDLDWEYRRDPQGRWELTGWQRNEMNQKGEVVYTARAEVKKLERDHKFGAEAFALKPPPSSYVLVAADGKFETYLIRADGSKHLLNEVERNKNLDELAKTNADGTPYPHEEVTRGRHRRGYDRAIRPTSALGSSRCGTRSGRGRSGA